MLHVEVGNATRTAWTVNGVSLPRGGGTARFAVDARGVLRWSASSETPFDVAVGDVLPRTVKMYRPQTNTLLVVGRAGGDPAHADDTLYASVFQQASHLEAYWPAVYAAWLLKALQGRGLPGARAAWALPPALGGRSLLRIQNDAAHPVTVQLQVPQGHGPVHSLVPGQVREVAIQGATGVDVQWGTTWARGAAIAAVPECPLAMQPYPLWNDDGGATPFQCRVATDGAGNVRVIIDSTHDTDTPAHANTPHTNPSPASPVTKTDVSSFAVHPGTRLRVMASSTPSTPPAGSTCTPWNDMVKADKALSISGVVAFGVGFVGIITTMALNKKTPRVVSGIFTLLVFVASIVMLSVASHKGSEGTPTGGGGSSGGSTSGGTTPSAPASGSGGGSSTANAMAAMPQHVRGALGDVRPGMPVVAAQRPSTVVLPGAF